MTLSIKKTRFKIRLVLCTLLSLEIYFVIYVYIGLDSPKRLCFILLYVYEDN
jgi:hypothetical protein